MTCNAKIDYGYTTAVTTLGSIGVKVWVYTGDSYDKFVNQFRSFRGKVEKYLSQRAEKLEAAYKEKVEILKNELKHIDDAEKRTKMQQKIKDMSVVEKKVSKEKETNKETGKQIKH